MVIRSSILPALNHKDTVKQNHFKLYRDIVRKIKFFSLRETVH